MNEQTPLHKDAPTATADEIASRELTIKQISGYIDDLHKKLSQTSGMDAEKIQEQIRSLEATKAGHQEMLDTLRGGTN